MGRVTNLGAFALLCGVTVSVVGCGRPAPQEVASVGDAGAAAASTSDHPRVLDTQRSRVFNAQVGAEKRIALHEARRRHHAAIDRHPLQPESANPNFTLVTGSPVVGAVSIFGQSFTTESDSDQMFFGTQGSGPISSGLVGGCTGCTASSNFFAVTNLHKASGPNISWSAVVSGGVSASNAMSATGDKIYVLGDSGILYCFQSANGSSCSGWTTPAALSLTGTGITPWVDTAANAVYVNDGGGNIYRFNATSGGTQQWSYNYASTGSKSWPLEANNIIYVGDGSGNLWRIVDPGTGTAPAAGAKSSVALSGISSTCASASNVSIDGSVSLDSTANLVFLSWQGCIYSLPHFCAAASGCAVTSGTWGTSSTVVAATSSTPDTTFRTWPALDGSYAHWVIADKPTGFTNVSSVWTAPYALSTVAGTALVNASSTLAGASTGSAPVIWAGDLYVGDQSGYVEEFGCATSSASAVSFLAETNAAAGPINTPIVLDDATGNIEYGFNDGVAQFPLWEGTSTTSFSWNCPSGMVACNSQQCGTGPDLTQCVPTAECNTGAGCSTVAAAGATVQVASGTEGSNVAGTQGSGGNQVCPTGTVILGVLGASYGTPPSSDGTAGTTFNFASGCYAADSLSVTESDCPLNTEENCTFSASSTTFGDPCVGTAQNYYGWFACGATAGSVRSSVRAKT